MKAQRTLGFAFFAIAAVPLVLWAAISLALESISVFLHPVSLGFRFYSNVDPDPGRSFQFPEIPARASIGILLSAAVVAFLWLRNARSPKSDS